MKKKTVIGVPVRQGAQGFQLKFNDSYNQHFPGLIFLKTILYVKAGKVEGEILNCFWKMVQ